MGTSSATSSVLNDSLHAIVSTHRAVAVERMIMPMVEREATSKPNASTIRELDEYVHKICTRGLGMELNF
jgi:hypothetical protein